MAIRVYSYPKCSTCRKALRWLDDYGVEYEASDLVADPIPLAKLADLHRRSGLTVPRLFNVHGESYRVGGFQERLKTMSDADALAELSKDGKLVKRPIVDTGTTVIFGFDEKKYDEIFG